MSDNHHIGGVVQSTPKTPASYILTWTKASSYRVELDVTLEALARWANTSGELRASFQLIEAGREITAADLAQMDEANPHFLRALLSIYAEKTMVLRPESSTLHHAAPPRITEVHPRHQQKRRRR